MNANGSRGVVAHGYLLSEGEFTIVDFLGTR
jgi:hypothetical protein